MKRSRNGLLSIILTLIIAAIPVLSFAEEYGFITKWGSQGSEDGQFSWPSGVAVGPDGSVYVADGNNHRIQKFGADGSFITKWGSLGSEDGQFNNPYRVAVGSDGSVYVADTFNHRIQKFSADGTFIAKWGSLGSADGQFNTPVGLAVGSDGSVYVADSYNYRIQKFGADGTFIAKWGSLGSEDGQFNNPWGVAVGPDGSVYVADGYNHRIQKFGADGTFIAKWGSLGSEDGQFNNPWGVAVGSDGSVYVADTFNHRIQKLFGADGSFITKWGSLGSEDGQFNNPRGVTVGSDGSVYVADTFNHRIQKFAILNNPPTVTNSTVTGQENTVLKFASEDFTSSFSDVDGDSLAKIKIGTLPLDGTITLNGVAVSANQDILVSEIVNLNFLPAKNWVGTTSFEWYGHDGTDYSVEPATMTIEIIVPVTGVSLNKSAITMDIGTTYQLAEQISPQNATNKAVSWETSDASVATVDSNGTVTAVGAGTATITATTEDGGFTANCIVTVNEPAGMEPIDEIISAFDEAVDNGLIEGNGNKNKIKLFAGILDVGKRLIENGNNRAAIVTLESAYKFIDGKSNPKDLVFGEASGEIANMIKDLIESLNINVEGVSLDKTEINMSVREMVRLTATVEPSDAINKTVKWSTNNSRVASVSNTGRILARRPGTAVITVTTQDGGFQATCVVTVNP